MADNKRRRRVLTYVISVMDIYGFGEYMKASAAMLKASGIVDINDLCAAIYRLRATSIATLSAAPSVGRSVGMPAL